MSIPFLLRANRLLMWPWSEQQPNAGPYTEFIHRLYQSVQVNEKLRKGLFQMQKLFPSIKCGNATSLTGSLLFKHILLFTEVLQAGYMP